jgi:hypothetical protein
VVVRGESSETLDIGDSIFGFDAEAGIRLTAQQQGSGSISSLMTSMSLQIVEKINRNICEEIAHINTNMTNMRKEVEHINTNMCKEIASLKEQVVTPSAAAHGQTILKKIEDRGICKLFEKEGKAVLTEEELMEVKSSTSEHALVDKLTPHFERLFKEFAVVNSETIQWLSTGLGAPQKPDLFVCPISFYERRKTPSPSNDGKTVYSNLYRYGVIKDTRLYDGIIILDCKLSCNNTAFGELCIHLEHLGQKQNIPTRGMLFSKEEFWLYEQERGVPVQFLKGGWTDSGSEAAIQFFFEKILGPFRDIDNVCKELNMRVLDPHTDRNYDTGFLGQGGFGRVIRVLPLADTSLQVNEPDMYAMKFVQNINNNSTQLIQEHRRLYNHHKQCQCGLIATSTERLIMTQMNITGFVFGPVGLTVNRAFVFDGNKIYLKDILMALYGLHSHKPPIYHGDPRLPNLILHESKLIWIDLIEYDTDANISSIEYARDMNILIKSLCPSLNMDNHNLCELIKAYSENPDAPSVGELETYLINEDVCL